MIRTIVSKAFNIDDPTLVDVVSETYDDGAVVEYPKPTPRMVLNVGKTQFLANGVDETLLTVSFEGCALVAGELVWSKIAPTGDVNFTINLRPTSVTLDAKGDAVLALSATVAGSYHVSASFPGYADASTNVGAML